MKRGTDALKELAELELLSHKIIDETTYFLVMVEDLLQ